MPVKLKNRDYKAKGKEPETFVGNPDLDIYTEIQNTLLGHTGFFRPTGSDFCHGYHAALGLGVTAHFTD